MPLISREVFFSSCPIFRERPNLKVQKGKKKKNFMKSQQPRVVNIFLFFENLGSEFHPTHKPQFRQSLALN